jgi:hypothetical protein
MKNLNLNQMENLNGGSSVSGRGCMIAGGLGTIALFIPGGGILAGLSIFAGAALSNCFLMKAPAPKEFITRD